MHGHQSGVHALGYDPKADIAPILSYMPTEVGSFNDGKVNIEDAACLNINWHDTET